MIQGLAHKVSEEHSVHPLKAIRVLQYFESRICGSGQLGLKNQP